MNLELRNWCNLEKYFFTTNEAEYMTNIKYSGEI